TREDEPTRVHEIDTNLSGFPFQELHNVEHIYATQFTREELVHGQGAAHILQSNDYLVGALCDGKVQQRAIMTETGLQTAGLSGRCAHATHYAKAAAVRAATNLLDRGRLLAGAHDE